MQKIETAQVHPEVIKALAVQNCKGWFSENRVTYLPKGDRPNREDNKAIVIHQTESGEYIVIDSYEF